MATAAYIACAQARALAPIYILTIEGIPDRWTAGGDALVALKITSKTLPYLGTTYHKRLIKNISLASEKVDALKGVTKVGGLSVNLEDISDFLTDLFKHSDPVGSITADVTAATTSIPVNNDALFAVGDAVFIGRETMYVTAKPGGNVLTVTRGMYGSQADAHSVSITSIEHDDDIYKRPPFWRNREVNLYANWDSSTVGAVDELLLFSGILRSIRLAENGITYNLQASSDLHRINRSVGFQVFEGKTDYTRINPRGTDGATFHILRRASEDGNPKFRTGTPGDKGWLRIGDDNIVEVELTSLGYGINYFRIIDVSKTALYNDNWQEGMAVREVVFSDILGGLETATPFAWGAVASSHPIDIFLCLATSTGAGTNGDWDKLPKSWGLGIPQAKFNLVQFKAIRSQTRLVDIRCNAFMLEEGFNLKDWAEKELWGPIGAYLYTDATGKISIGIVSDMGPLISVIGIDNGSLLELPQVDLQIGSQFTQIKMELDDRGRKETLIVRGVLTAERFPDDNLELTYKTKGFSLGDESALEWNMIAIISGRDKPEMSLNMDLDYSLHYAIVAGDILSITQAFMPNLSTGSRGFTARNFRVTDIHFKLPIGEDRPALEIEAEEMTDRKIGHVAPSARVVSWNAGLKKAIVQPNDFTPTDGNGNPVPASDAAAFAVNDRVCLRNADGDYREGGKYITAILGNDITIDSVWVVVPAAGDIVCYDIYDANTTTGQKKRVALADELTGTIGGTADPPYYYAS